MVKGGVVKSILGGIGEELKESSKVVVEQIGVAKKKAPQDDRQTFLKGLYGEGKQMTDLEIAEKTLEDKKKEEELKQQLHNQYYQNFIHPPKPREIKDARPAEKLEKEKQMEELKMQEKKAKKPQPLPLSTRQQQGSSELSKQVGG